MVFSTMQKKGIISPTGVGIQVIFFAHINDLSKQIYLYVKGVKLQDMTRQVLINREAISLNNSAGGRRKWCLSRDFNA